MARKRTGTRQTGSEVESKRQKRDLSSSTDRSGRETSTTTTTSTSDKLTSTTTPMTSDMGSPPGNIGSPPGNTGTDAAHNDDTAHDTMPPDSTGDQSHGPATGPPPAGKHCIACLYSCVFVIYKISSGFNSTNLVFSAR